MVKNPRKIPKYAENTVGVELFLFEFILLNCSLVKYMVKMTEGMTVLRHQAK